jgi:hypothetical protein
MISEEITAAWSEAAALAKKGELHAAITRFAFASRQLLIEADKLRESRLRLV